MNSKINVNVYLVGDFTEEQIDNLKSILCDVFGVESSDDDTCNDDNYDDDTYDDYDDEDCGCNCDCSYCDECENCDNRGKDEDFIKNIKIADEDIISHFSHGKYGNKEFDDVPLAEIFTRRA